MAGPTSEKRTAVELAEHGLRATRQRIGVLRALRLSRTHPTARQLHEALTRQQPNVSLKTIYETLDSLIEAGLATPVMHGGEPHRYEAVSEPHYHARCRVCGRLFDLAAHSDDHIRSRTPIPAGFEVEQISVTLMGRCPRCQTP